MMKEPYLMIKGCAYYPKTEKTADCYREVSVDNNKGRIERKAW